MTDFTKTICVIGLGYIGLPTASLLGTKGYKVHGVDTSEHVVDTINKGRIHIVEPDLDILVKSAVHSGNLTAGLEHPRRQMSLFLRFPLLSKTIISQIFRMSKRQPG